jgi:uncharacterized membrane protein
MTAGRDPFAFAGIVLAVLGLAVSGYLTAAHYASVPLACVTTGPVDCGAVTSSSFSVIPGTAVPITILGLLWFGTSAAAFWMEWREREPEWLPAVHFALAAAGVLVVLYLVYAEIVVINRICEWCTLVHLLVIGMFFIALRRLQSA